MKRLRWQEWESDIKKWIAEHSENDIDLNNHNDSISETIEPSSDLIVPLLRFQKEWLAWSLRQEESVHRGGILADEMGMGKTVQAISLVLKKRAIRRHELQTSSTTLPSSSTTLPKVCPMISTTLVICPLAVCKQWVSEIDSCTSEGSTRALLYEGTDRKKKVYQFSDYDFVITAYTTLEVDYRYLILPKTSGENEKGPDCSILHSVQWDRIILDEAHYIKNDRSNTARAVFDLQSSYKWALSGTPFQNSVKDLHSLVRFLQMHPYCYYLCRSCDCSSLDYSAPTKCPRCPHVFRHFSWWNKYISTPVEKHGNTGTGRDSMILLKHRILKRIMLRRTKEGRSAELRIHPKTVIERWLILDETEELYYKMAYKECLTLLNRDVEAGTPMNDILFNYVFDLVLHLRKVADHPYFQIFATEEKGTEQCGLCDDPVEGLRVISCAHIFCKSCLSSLPSSSCPLCSKPLTVDFTGKKKSEAKRSILDRIKIENFQSSTKIEALREEISDMFERDGSAKGIVFSEFSSFLDLIHFALKRTGVLCVQVDGYTPKHERPAAIKKFKEDPSCRILLTTFKVGGVGLNVTVASNVFLMEPSWNPLVEQQAQDRIHRIGQYKPTRIVRFLFKATIEERLLELQEMKRKLFEGTVGDCSENPRKSRESDLRFILQL